MVKSKLILRSVTPWFSGIRRSHIVSNGEFWNSTERHSPFLHNWYYTLPEPILTQRRFPVRKAAFFGQKPTLLMFPYRHNVLLFPQQEMPFQTIGLTKQDGAVGLVAYIVPLSCKRRYSGVYFAVLIWHSRHCDFPIQYRGFLSLPGGVRGQQ